MKTELKEHLKKVGWSNELIKAADGISKKVEKSSVNTNYLSQDIRKSTVSSNQIKIPTDSTFISNKITFQYK